MVSSYLPRRLRGFDTHGTEDLKKQYINLNILIYLRPYEPTFRSQFQDTHCLAIRQPRLLRNRDAADLTCNSCH